MFSNSGELTHQSDSWGESRRIAGKLYKKPPIIGLRKPMFPLYFRLEPILRNP